jgi:hypothetical protein
MSCSMREQTLETTPVAVSALSGDSLSRNAIVSEQDLQTAVPGLTVKASQSDNQLNYSLRGQTVDAYSSSQPSVLPCFNEVQVASSDPWRSMISGRCTYSRVPRAPCSAATPSAAMSSRVAMRCISRNGRTTRAIPRAVRDGL